MEPSLIIVLIATPLLTVLVLALTLILSVVFRARRMKIEAKEREKREAEAMLKQMKLDPQVRPIAFKVKSQLDVLGLMGDMNLARALVCRCEAIQREGQHVCEGACVAIFNDLIGRVHGNRPPDYLWERDDVIQLLEAALRYALEQVEARHTERSPS